MQQKYSVLQYPWFMSVLWVLFRGFYAVGSVAYDLAFKNLPIFPQKFAFGTNAGRESNRQLANPS